MNNNLYFVGPTPNIHYHASGRGHFREYQATFAHKSFALSLDDCEGCFRGLVNTETGWIIPLNLKYIHHIIGGVWIIHLIWASFFFFFCSCAKACVCESQGSALIRPLNIWCFIWQKCMRGGRDQTLIPPPARLGSAYCLHSAISRHC